MSAIEDNVVAVILAVPLVILIALRPYRSYARWLAPGLLALYGLVGIVAFLSTCFGSDVHVALYGAVVLTALLAAWFIDSKATVVVVVCVAVAAVITLAVSLLGEVLNAVGDFPTELVKHLVWVIVGLVAVVLAFVFARPQAAVLVLVMLAAAGFHELVWAYDGARRQDLDVWGIVTIVPDQGFYGFLFLVSALALALAPGRSRRRKPKPEEDETEEMPRPELDERARDLLARLYELDKRKRVFDENWSRFLVWALRRLGVSRKELEDAGVTVEAYARYAADRAITELSEAELGGRSVVRKDGSINPTKLAKLGFRKDFLTSHSITNEELLAGEVDLPEDEAEAA